MSNTILCIYTALTWTTQNMQYNLEQDCLLFTGWNRGIGSHHYILIESQILFSHVSRYVPLPDLSYWTCMKTYLKSPTVFQECVWRMVSENVRNSTSACQFTPISVPLTLPLSSLYRPSLQQTMGKERPETQKRNTNFTEFCPSDKQYVLISENSIYAKKTSPKYKVHKQNTGMIAKQRLTLLCLLRLIKTLTETDPWCDSNISVQGSGQDWSLIEVTLALCHYTSQSAVSFLTKKPIMVCSILYTALSKMKGNN